MKTQLFRLAFRVLPHLPRPLLQVLAVIAADIVWLTASGTRSRVRANLAHIPTLAANPDALNRTVRRSFRALLWNYLDLFTPPDLTNPQTLAELTIDHWNMVQQLRDEGKGCIMLCLHSNGFEWGRHYLPHFIHGRFIAPVESVQPPDLFALLQHERSKSGIEFLPINESDTLRKMITGLRAGAHVVVALDRDVLHTGVEMPFFGADARIPPGPAALSRMTGAPIYIMSLWRTGFRRLEGHISTEAIVIDPKMRGDEATREALKPLVRLIEREVLRHPEGWLAAFADDIWISREALNEREGVTVATSAEAHNKI